MTALNTSFSSTLPAGQAMSLRAHQAGVFIVTQGTAWATLDGPHAGHTQVQGDQFLQAGNTLPLQRGQRMVLEPIGAASAVSFSWMPVAQSATQCSPAAVRASWREGVAQPARDLVQALHAVFGAMRRLALGLVGMNTRAAAGHCRA